MAKAKKIGILTGGGDVPGLNSVIKSVTYRGSQIGRSVVGIRTGWKGLTHLDPDHLADLLWNMHRTKGPREVIHPATEHG